MKLKKITELGVASIVSLSSLLAIGIPLASAATISWSGGGGADTKISTAANWVGGIVPTTGDTLVFPAGAGVTNKTVINDLTAGTSFAGISFSGTAAANETDGYILSGNAMKLSSSGLTTVSTIGNVFENISTPIEFSANQAITVTTGANIALHGVLSGTGNLSKLGDGGIFLQVDNTFTGSLTSSGGTIYVSTAGGLGSAAAGAIIGPNSDLNFNTCADPFTINKPLTLTGTPSSTATGKINFQTFCGGGGGGTDEYYGYNVTSATNFTVASPITLGSDVAIDGNANSVTLTGALSGSYKFGLAPKAGMKLVLAGSTNTTNSPNGTLTQPTIVQTLSDNSTKTVEIADRATISIDGARGDVTVDKGGILMGTGKIGLLIVSQGGIAAPGHSPGCIASGNLTLNGTYQAQIGGTDPCTGYDQLNVTGTVDLGTGTLASTLQTSLYGGFVPKVGQSFTIISNDAADAVTGTFKGLAEGALFAADGVTYKITYKGGDGNDVVLTVTSVNASNLPKTPNTGFNLVTAHPLLALGTTVTAALALLIAARKFKPVK